MAKVFTITEGLENMGALSTGGQGSVYKGKRMGAIITAVKLLPTPIHTESDGDKNFRDFQNEVEKLKKVNEIPNPNVVKIVNSGLTESGSLPFIEMEYIEGPDLEALLKAPHPPVFTIRETIKLATHLSNALAHCHRAGVKHGDIKSNNVKFNNATGNYILLDFGLAVMSDEQRRSSLRHAGAVEFMAPEQHDGEFLFQSDIYSFGIILFELLAGSVPFPLINKADTYRNQVMLSHIEKPLPSILDLRRDKLPSDWSEEQRSAEMQIPKWLLDVIYKCLEKSPSSRYPDGVALHDAVCHHQENKANESADVTMANSEVLLLKTENEQLTAKVATYERYFKNKIVLFIASLIIVSLITLALSSGWTESRPITNPADTAVQNITDTTVVKQPIKRDTPTTVKPPVKKSAPSKTRDGIINDVPEF
jgi:eukaryotic-like serine/threonine-protein kinase